MKSILSSRIWITLSALILVATSKVAIAQSAPDAVFDVTSAYVCAGSFFDPFDPQISPGSWNEELTTQINDGYLTRTGIVSGSTTSNSLTFSQSTLQDGDSGFFSAECNSLQYVAAYVKGNASAVVTVETDLSVEGNGYFTNVSASPGDAPGSALQIGPVSNGSDSGTLHSTKVLYHQGSCSSSGGILVDGVRYRSASLGGWHRGSAFTKISGGHTYSQSTVTVTITREDEEPEAILEGPSSTNLSYVPVSDPQIGTTIYFFNRSIDPDDHGDPLDGICSWTWKVTKPDETISTSTGSTYKGITLSLAGRYTIELTVTDNEGNTTNTEQSFWVAKRDPRADGRDKKECVECGSDGKAEVCTTPGNGGGHLRVPDPVATRSTPLANDLRINTQTMFPSRTTVFGNANFTYGAEVTTTTLGGVSHWMVIDGEGRELDYGPASASPVGGAGNYSVLTVTGSGYQLSAAGGLREIWKAGNFTYEFNSLGKLVSITDPEGNVQTVTFNGSGDPSLVTDLSSGRTIAFQYDTPGFVARIVEGLGEVVTHITYSSGKISNLAVKDSLGNTTREFAITYNGDGLLQTVTRDGDSGSTITFSYTDPSRSGVKLVNLSWTGGGTNYDYDNPPPTASISAGAVYRVTRSFISGDPVHYDFSRTGDLIKENHSRLNVNTDSIYTYTYDSNHNRLSEHNGYNTRSMTYDALGQLLTYSDAAGGAWAFTYNGRDLATVSDITGTLWTLDYDDINNPHRITEATDARGNTWTYTYNSYGQLLTRTPPTGSPSGTETFTYEENISSPNYGYLLSYENGAGDITQFDSYTSLGDLTSMTTFPVTGVTSTRIFEYDAGQRLIEVTHPDSKIYSMSYTGRDLTQIVDEAGTSYSMTYCANCGKMTSWNGPLSKTLSWTVDGDRNITSFTDGRGKVSNFDYYAGGILDGIDFPTSGGYGIDINYDNAGRVKYFLMSNQSYSVTYDAADRIAAKDYGGSATADDQSFSWNTDGTLQQVATSAKTSNYTYLPNKLVESASFNMSGSSLTNIQTVDYTYYMDDSLESVTWKDAGTTVASWIYTYDGAGRLASITNSFGEVTTYTYDGEGKLQSQTNHNGTSVVYDWNHARGWPTEISHKLSGTPFAEYDLVYDASSNTVGNLTGVTELSGATVSYGYDALYRLTSEARTGSGAYSQTLGYDLANNITQMNGGTFGTYGNGNQMTKVGTTNIGLHGDGYVTTLPSSTLAGITQSATLTWGAYGKLKQVVTGGVTYQFTYDARGRRVSRTQSSGAPAAIHYIYSGDTLIGEIHNGVPTIVYTWGVGGILSERILSGTPRSLWYHMGPQGETRQLTNASGAVANTYSYNAYGRQLASTGSEPNPFRYGAKFGYYTDLPQNLMLIGQRWYSPHLMRWLIRDPITYSGGENVYGYVQGNPVKYVDPDGLARLYNQSDYPIRVKPEEEMSRPPRFCPGLSCCNIDGVFPNDIARPPIKIPDNCEGELGRDGTLNVECHSWNGLPPWLIFFFRPDKAPQEFVTNLEEWQR